MTAVHASRKSSSEGWDAIMSVIFPSVYCREAFSRSRRTSSGT